MLNGIREQSLLLNLKPLRRRQNMYKIMVVDDEAVVTTQLEESLTSMGYEVAESVYSGKEAVDSARRLRPDLILMDIVMPGGLDGIAAAQIIKEELDIPVIFLTAYADDNLINRAKNSEPFGYIVKPFQEKEIRAAIEIALYKKEMERRLCESEERYRSVVDTAIEAIITVDSRGNIVSWNHAAETMFGYRADESAGKRLTFIIPERLRKHLENEMDLIVSTGKSNIIGKTLGHSGLRKDGTEFPMEFSLATWNTNKGAFFTIIVRDISERKRAEEEQRKLEALLQRARKMEAIGTLAGGVAHDLNNILAGLVSYPDLLLLEIPEDSPLRNPILTIQKSGEKAAAVVQDLLTLARGGFAVTEVVNLNDIISEYLKSPEHQRLISFHPGVNVSTDLEEDLLNILGSPVHLSKAIMNLVSNAAEAMPEGGEISISTENQYIDRPITGYDYVKEGDYVVLKLFDTGVGISKKDRERIFEPFYTKKAMGRSGTGLGMTVVWGTVKDHKGYIDVKSAKGKGTTFTIYFPVTRKEVAKDKPLPSIEDYMGKGESVLVVDDVLEQREIAYRILKKLGYSVTFVSSGEEAIDYLKNNSADLLVLDMIMDPGIDGLETYKRILEFHPGQKALIVSGFSETKRVKEARRLGAGAYVKKPFLLRKIGLAVRDELER
jgi:PAS domain S-box-containing protein